MAVADDVGRTGIGHTRWATHGRVSEENAHPHFDSLDRVHVVVNGIVENYFELKRELEERGWVFTSETDAEVIAHLVSEVYRGDLAEAVMRAYARLQGLFAFVAMSAEEPDLLVGARRDCPLVVGPGRAGSSSSPRPSRRSWPAPAGYSTSRTARSCCSGQAG